MALGGIDRAVLCSFDSSPDLAAIHAALVQSPDRFRGLGVPLGNDHAEMEASSRAQLEAGFSGLRLTDQDIAERGFLLDIVAGIGRLALVVGQVSSARTSRTLLTALERHPGLRLIGGHFAGVDDPAVLTVGPAAELFAHPRFSVVFSRHGGFPEAALDAWADAVIARCGWSHILWGSEAPVMFWRNETIGSAVAWIDRFAPTPEQRAAFFSGNAERLYFSEPAVLSPLLLSFDPHARAKAFPATLWARGWPIDQRIAGRLVAAWLAAGGDGTLGAYLERHLDETLPK